MRDITPELDKMRANFSRFWYGPAILAENNEDLPKSMVIPQRAHAKYMEGHEEDKQISPGAADLPEWLAGYYKAEWFPVDTNWITINARAKEIYLSMVVIAEEHQGKGHLRALVDAILGSGHACVIPNPVGRMTEFVMARGFAIKSDRGILIARADKDYLARPVVHVGMIRDQSGLMITAMGERFTHEGGRASAYVLMSRRVPAPPRDTITFMLGFTDLMHVAYKRQPAFAKAYPMGYRLFFHPQSKNSGDTFKIWLDGMLADLKKLKIARDAIRAAVKEK